MAEDLKSTKNGEENGLKNIELKNFLVKKAASEIDQVYNEAYKLVRKGKAEVWEVWAEHGIELKTEMEKILESYDYPQDICHLYAFWQTKNELLNLHLQTRLGKISQKKSLEKTCSILWGLIHGAVQPRTPDQIVAKVRQHLFQLNNGKVDIICLMPIKKSGSEEKTPTTILTPKDED